MKVSSSFIILCWSSLTPCCSILFKPRLVVSPSRNVPWSISSILLSGWSRFIDVAKSGLAVKGAQKDWLECRWLWDIMAGSILSLVVRVVVEQLRTSPVETSTWVRGFFSFFDPPILHICWKVHFCSSARWIACSAVSLSVFIFKAYSSTISARYESCKSWTCLQTSTHYWQASRNLS